MVPMFVVEYFNW